METDRLSHSLSAQVSYYSDLIQNNPEWEYAGVYADSFVSGTGTEKRTEFQRLIADCDAGLIDIVLCKSIPASLETHSTCWKLSATQKSWALPFTSRRKTSILCRVTAS